MAIPTSLNGKGWRLGVVGRAPADTFDLYDVAEWLPATVPGDVRADLFAAGRIPDPLAEPEASAWVDDHDWWYVHDLPALPPDRRATVLLDGVDYQFHAYQDWRSLGGGEGMFRRHTFHLNPTAVPGTLAVRLVGGGGLPRLRLSPRQHFERRLAHALNWGDLYPDRFATLKCQMSFGWDFAPRLLTLGLWDDAWLHVYDTVRIGSARVRTLALGERAQLEVVLDLESRADVQVEVVVGVTGENFTSDQLNVHQPAMLVAGRSRVKVPLALPEPRLWEPWDRGEPNLYRLRVEIRRGGDELDVWEDTFGLRTFALAHGAGQPRGEPGWEFRLNGRREYVRGANWVPADSLFGRLGEADYVELIGLARKANVNMLRVWGGGLREKRAFYDACDRAGILVWQEFLLACAFFDRYPDDAAFLRLAAAEARGIVRALRNHPSLVLWCGGNEVNPGRQRRLLGTFAWAVAEADGERPFRSASPSRGDAHYWRVWHGYANADDYRKVDAAVVSEFGEQAPPDVESLERFLPQDALWPPGEAWEKHRAQLDKLWRYAGPLAPRDLREFVAASQRAQAHALQRGIEHWRRRKGRMCGSLVWQFNEPWPAISWSIVDYFRRPKLAYHRLSVCYAPVLASLDYPLKPYSLGDTFAAEVWAVNDLTEAVAGAELRIFAGDRERERLPFACTTDAARHLGSITFALDSLWLRLEVWQEGRLLSGNEYDLGYYDPGRITRIDALRSWITEWSLK